MMKNGKHYYHSFKKKARHIPPLNLNIFIFLLQYMGLMQSTLSKTSAILWLGNGTALAFLFLRGLTILPGIFLGSFFAYLFITPMQHAFLAACIHTLEPYAILTVTYR